MEKRNNIISVLSIGLVLLFVISCSYMKTDLGDESIDVTIPGIRMYLEYYPWAVRHGDDDGEWMSCNREGGYVLRRDGRVWVKEKNRDNDADHSVVFTRNASAWAIAPRIGQE